jgi:hypothetical protein
MKSIISPWVRSPQAGVLSRIIFLTLCLLAGLTSCQPEKKKLTHSFAEVTYQLVECHWKQESLDSWFKGKELPAVTKLNPGSQPPPVAC